jgi:hypothetical protein
MRTPFAQIIIWTLREPRRWLIREDNALRLLLQLPCKILVVMNALQVIAVVVFTDSDIDRSLHPRLVHVALHLSIMLGLGLLDPFLHQQIEALFIVSFELPNVPSLRSFLQPQDGGIH